MVEISVIVVNWNGRQYLQACLDALASQQAVEFETLVVDNGSTDGSAEFVRAQFPAVRVVALADNLGFAGGNNAGAREARGRHLVFLNNDTVVEPGWLAALRRAVDDPPGFALVTSKVVYMHDPGLIDSAGDGVLQWGAAFKRFHGTREPEAERSGEVFGVCGAACLVTKAVFDELGGFDEHFFVSHEDVDLSYRARLLGYRCRYAADAVVRHHGSVTLGRTSALAVFHGQRNLEWLYLKNSPLSILLRSMPGHLLYTAAAAGYFARLGLLGAFLRAKLAAAAGVPRVLRQRAHVQRTRRVGAGAIWPLLERRWLATKWREKRFDVGLAGER
ncbi:MAG TPA: glycosyltransferase family 2 protein [Vicinamibacterales bacterium]|nr:glycosyltransferase family 2 protein [Vicinamibacterales bacterium]